MSKTINMSFDLVARGPLDIRRTVSTYAGLALIAAPYEGLITFVVDTKIEYIFKNGGWVTYLITGITSLTVGEPSGAQSIGNVVTMSQTSYGTAVSNNQLVSGTGYIVAPDLESSTFNTFTQKIILSPAEIITIGTIPVPAIASPGVGKFIDVVGLSSKFIWGTIAYDGVVELHYDGGSLTGWNISSQGVADLKETKVKVATIEWEESKAVVFGGFDSIAAGDSTIEVWITYRILTSTIQL
jgi:hypothetical protein